MTPGGAASRDPAMHALLVGLAVALFVLQPLADLGRLPAWLPPFVTLLTLAAGVVALQDRALGWPAAALALLLGVAMAADDPATAGVAGGAGLLVIALALLRRVLAPGEVTRQRLEGAVALYLVIALAFASAYEALAAVEPAAFAGAAGLPQSFRYFSLVVQTSTGFGDIAPATPVARTLVTAQAVLGQLYIAIILARLVSLGIGGRR